MIERDCGQRPLVDLSGAGGYLGLALSLLLARMVPAVDRLTDSLARGYWEARLCAGR